MSTIGFHHLIQRVGKAAKMPFPLHPHMLRHACGYKLANDGHDTRALQPSATTTSSTPSDTPSFRRTGSATSGAIRLAPDPGSVHLNVNNPYQRVIADAIADPAVERVSVLKSARIGLYNSKPAT